MALVRKDAGGDEVVGGTLTQGVDVEGAASSEVVQPVLQLSGAVTGVEGHHYTIGVALLGRG